MASFHSPVNKTIVLRLNGLKVVQLKHERSGRFLTNPLVGRTYQEEETKLKDKRMFYRQTSEFNFDLMDFPLQFPTFTFSFTSK